MAKSKVKPKKPDLAKGIDRAVEHLGQAGANEPSQSKSGSEKVRLVEDDTGHRILIYATSKGINVELRFDGDTFWASQAQMAEMFGVDRTSITKHLGNIYDERELEKAATCEETSQVRKEGQRKVQRAQPIYNLNAMISVGYRVNSKQGTMFRIWATERLVQILTKGFYVDKERLKNQGAPDVLCQHQHALSVGGHYVSGLRHLDMPAHPALCQY